MTTNEVWEWIRFACECNGRSDIAGRIRLEWSNRLTSSMGNASKKAINDYYVIRLSIKLFARASDEERRQTVIHEACHVIDGIVNNTRMSHGSGWATCMRRADSNPERCHTVSNAGLVKRFVYTCSDGCVEHAVSARMHNSIRRGKNRVCCKCRARLEYAGRAS